MVTTDGRALIVMFPRCQNEQLASGTRIHALTVGLSQISKAILLQIDEWIASFKGCTHDSLLTT